MMPPGISEIFSPALLAAKGLSIHFGATAPLCLRSKSALLRRLPILFWLSRTRWISFARFSQAVRDGFGSTAFSARSNPLSSISASILPACANRGFSRLFPLFLAATGWRVDALPPMITPLPTQTTPPSVSMTNFSSSIDRPRRRRQFRSCAPCNITPFEGRLKPSDELGRAEVRLFNDPPDKRRLLPSRRQCLGLTRCLPATAGLREEADYADENWSLMFSFAHRFPQRTNRRAIIPAKTGFKFCSTTNGS